MVVWVHVGRTYHPVAAAAVLQKMHAGKGAALVEAAHSGTSSTGFAQ
jgi:hypothetical protein